VVHRKPGLVKCRAAENSQGTGRWNLRLGSAMLFLGIETGLRGSRGIVLDLEAAEVVAEASVPPVFVDGLPEGHREQDPAQWIAATNEVARRCIGALGDRRDRLAAIGVAGPLRGLVALDADSRIVRPAKVEGDRSAWRQGEMLARAFGGAPGLIELTGNPLLPFHAAPGILWLKQHEPYHFQKTATFLPPHDFINYWLTAVRKSGFCGASASGIFDVRCREWCRDLLDWIDPRLVEMLPVPVSPLDPHGPLRPEVAAAWGVSREVLVAAGAPDLMAALVAAGCVSDGDLMVALGTGTDIACVSGLPVTDARGEVAALCDMTGVWLGALAMSGGSRAPDLIRRHYGWSPGQFEALVAAAPAGAGGLLLLPYLEGERIPALPDGCGVLHGITPDNFTPDNLARAALEGVVLGIGYGLTRLRDLGLAPTELRVTGIAAASGVWRQLLADVTGLPVVAPGAFRGAAMGAALQAAITFFRQSGESLSFAEIAAYTSSNEAAARCEPDGERHQIYQQLVSRQQYLVDTLHPAGFL
jgi:xylulokinase